MEELLKLAERMIESAENGQVGSNGWEYDLAVFRERYQALSMSGVVGRSEQFNCFLEDSEQGERCETKCNDCNNYKGVRN